MLNEGNSFGSAIRNKRLRKMLDDAGYQDVELVKGDGYLYVDASDGQHYDWLNSLDSTSIYLNSFNQQTPEEWFNDIIVMLRKGRNAYIEKNPDGPIDEDFACGVGDVGLNQGIPHGGDGKGVVPTPMGEPVKKPKKKKKNLFRDYLSKYNV